MTGVGGAVDNMKRNNMNSLDFAREYRKKDQKSLFSGGDWGGGGKESTHIAEWKDWISGSTPTWASQCIACM